MPPPETDITSLEAFMGFIDDHEAETLWYRGCGDSSYDLKPSLYRHRLCRTASQFFELEWQMLTRFTDRSIPFLPRSLSEKDYWGHLFLMQHHGVPTRLLDWTENAYIGLYFALADAKYKRKDDGKPEYMDERLVYEKPAGIWILDPVAWNQRAIQAERIVGISNRIVQNTYAPRNEPEAGDQLPVAIYGKYNSARIVAQRGAFTIFGTVTDPMEEMYDTMDFSPNCLHKLNIPAVSIGKLLNDLGKIGVTDSIVFPDLDGLAKEIKREFNFLV